MGKHQAYPEYKDSGIELLGELPTEWKVLRYKNILKIMQGMAFKSSEYVDPSSVVNIRMGNIKKGGCLDLKHNTKYLPDNYKDIYSDYELYEGDAIIAMTDMSPTLDFLAVPAILKGLDGNTSYLLNQRVGKLLLDKEFDIRFVRYLLLSDELRSQLKGKGLGTVQANMSNEDLYSSYLFCPPIKERLKIANFLDHETAKIDTLIEKQQQLIALLKEKRQAVISHAVTKGLNPDVPMRDSGVEWLGDVPEHWDVSQVGHCAFVTKLTGFEYTNLWKTDEDGAVIALRGFNVKERKLELNDVENISLDLSTSLKRSKLATGDIVFPCTGTIGNAAMIEADDKFHINQNIAKIRFDESVSSRFAIYWLTSTFIRTLIDKNNTSGMQPVVLIGDIRKLPIPRFKYEEQEAVADYLDSVSDRFNILISNAISAIHLMRERRTALISAAVTGKIDVRNWKAA